MDPSNLGTILSAIVLTCIISETLQTFQELILARNPVFKCGQKTLLWDDMLRGLEFLAIIDHYVNDKRAQFHPYKGRDNSWYRRQVRKHNCQLSRNGFEFRTPVSTTTWRTLCSLWMTLNRKRRWNGSPTFSDPLEEKFSFEDCLTKGKQILEVPEKWSFYAVLVASLCLIIIPALALGKVIATDRRILALPIVGLLLGIVLFIPPCISNRHRNGPHFVVPSGEGFKVSYEEAIFRAIRSRQAKDPKDRSYAMYGVLKAFDLSLATPDYSLSCGAIYQTFFFNLLCWRPNLNVLIDAGYPAMRGCPSWVPNWDATSRNRWVDERMVHYSSDWYTDQANVKAYEIWKLKKDTLIVRGNVESTVGRCYTPFEETLSEENVIECWLQYFSLYVQSWRGHDSHILPSIIEVMYGREQRSLNFDQRQNCKAWGEIMLAGVSKVLLGDAFPDIRSRCLADIMADDRARACQTDLFTRHKRERRCFFLVSTSGGGLVPLGTASHHVNEGDHIAYMDGVTMPLVVRARGWDTLVYELIGPAFIYECHKDADEYRLPGALTLHGPDWNSHRSSMQELVLV